jgi:hypothetical protein
MVIAIQKTRHQIVQRTRATSAIMSPGQRGDLRDPGCPELTSLVAMARGAACDCWHSQLRHL